MIRKWEHIAEVCEIWLGEDHEATEIARQIDQDMVEMYGKNLHTEEWKRYTKSEPSDISNPYEYVMNIAKQTYTCTACMVSKEEAYIKYGYFSYKCAMCEFGEIRGICTDYDSLYRKFIDIIRKANYI